MDKFKAIKSLVSVRFRQWNSNRRLQMILLLVVLMIFNILSGVRQVSIDTKIPLSPWAVTGVLNTFDSLIIILLGYVFIYCDAPFLDELQPYVLLRCGRSIFCKAQILYIAASSFVYAVFIWATSLLCSLPNLSFSLSWGKVLKTAATIGLSNQYGSMLQLSASTIQMPALEAFLKEMLLLWLTGCFIGLLIFLLNLRFSRAVGITCASVLVFCNMFASMFSVSHGVFGGVIYWFLPTSWANLGILQSQASDPLPPFAYAVGMLLLLNGLFSVLIYRTFRKKEIEVLPQI